MGLFGNSKADIQVATARILEVMDTRQAAALGDDVTPEVVPYPNAPFASVVLYRNGRTACNVTIELKPDHDMNKVIATTLRVIYEELASGAKGMKVKRQPIPGMEGPWVVIGDGNFVVLAVPVESTGAKRR
jgi:hypothetical protein